MRSVTHLTKPTLCLVEVYESKRAYKPVKVNLREMLIRNFPSSLCTNISKGVDLLLFSNSHVYFKDGWIAFNVSRNACAVSISQNMGKVSPTYRLYQSGIS